MKSHIIHLILLTTILSTLFSASITPVYGRSVDLRVVRVFWGVDPNRMMEAHPGDDGIPLTIEVQNRDSHETIFGVMAVLDLGESPFTDIYGKSNATATTSGMVPPKGFFTLTFNLDIDSDAPPGYYSCGMAVYYSLDAGTYSDGEPQLLALTITVDRGPSNIVCSVTPGIVEMGETVTVEGYVEPVREGLAVTLSYRRPDASAFNRTVKTLADGSYRDYIQPDQEGFWSVNASWGGDEWREGDWSSASFEVTQEVSVHISIPDSRLIGDREKGLNITISNTGEVAISKMDIYLVLASTPATSPPLAVREGTHWSITHLEPGETAVIPVTIYASKGAVGSTYTASLELIYQDIYGRVHRENYNLGLVVKGWIDLIVYDLVVEPQSVSPGSDLTVTATILNRGIVEAMYTNATIVSNDILELSSSSRAYIGEVDENSPVPFTVKAKVKPDIEEGVYPIEVDISYRDDEYNFHTLSLTLDISVEKPHVSETEEGGPRILDLILELKWTILILAGTSIAVFILYWKHASRGESLTPP